MGASTQETGGATGTKDKNTTSSGSQADSRKGGEQGKEYLRTRL